MGYVGALMWLTLNDILSLVSEGVDCDEIFRNKKIGIM